MRDFTPLEAAALDRYLTEPPEGPYPCNKCDEEFRDDEALTFDFGGQFCDDCLTGWECDGCGEAVARETMTDHDGSLYCAACVAGWEGDA